MQAISPCCWSFGAALPCSVLSASGTVWRARSFVRSLEGRTLAGSQLDLFIGSLLIAI